jgi:hypothetical protein
MRSILKKQLISIVSLIAVLFTACTSSKNNPTPEGKLFSYAGVIVGSTGHYTLEITRTGATALVIFDGISYNLSIAKEIQIDKDINNLVLTDGAISLTYNYKYATYTASIEISIPGHTVTSTLGIVYDYRNPTIYSTISEPIKLYEGSSTSTMNTSYINFISNLSLDYVNKKFFGIEKCTASSNPDNIGDVHNSTGSFKDTESRIILYTTYDSELDSIIFIKDGNTLKHDATGDNNYSLHINYKKVN